MRGAELGPDHEAATRIFTAGWRQGSVIRAADVPDLPAEGIEPDDWLVVCTQSCSVVNPRFNVDTVVEWVVGRPVQELTSEKTRGKNARLFQLTVDGLPGSVAIECDVNRRFFQRRNVLLGIVPAEGVKPQEGAARAFAGWLSRYYSRVALPNALDRRAKMKKGIFSAIRTLLDKSAPSGNGTFHGAIHSIYVKWRPDEELPDGEPYHLDLLFLCKEERDATELEHSLLAAVATTGSGKDGIVIETLVAQAISETFVVDLETFFRLSEWDYLSDLGDVAEIDGR